MYWGIDLGGTKIEGVVMTGLTPDTVIARHRIETQGNKGYDHILNRIKSLVTHLSELTGHYPTKIGIGTPGTIEPDTGLLKNSNTICLNGRPIDKDLAKLLNAEVFIANDANCFALAEYRMGVIAQKHPNANVVFGVIMGTGVGGGLIVNGNIIGGRHGIGGEWGHMFLDDSGTTCYCGRKGCVETIISGPALEKYYLQLSGVEKRLPEILSTEADENSNNTKQRLIYFFGKAIGQLINVIDPDVIVIGGGLSNIPFLYTDGVASISNHIFTPTLNTPIEPPVLGDSAGVYGAAMLSA